MDKESILNLYPFYREGPTQLQRQIAQVTQEAQLPVGTEYYREGESCTRLALIGEGRVRVYKSSSSGRQITLYHVGPGESCILTASCALTGLSYPATAVVEGDQPLEALIIPADSFRAWVAQYDEVRSFVFQLMSDRLTSMMMLVEEVAFGKMDRRLAAFLLRHVQMENPTANSLAMTHDQIASELGSAREVISRILKDFERHGILEVSRGKINILNIRKLNQIEELE
jgi:CRP/FNR family transcriptional regulator, anaerobic regulatory protein